MTASMMVGFPVDYLYGWDMAWPTHQNLLRQCYEEFMPAHVFGAPTCTPWSSASASKNKDQRMQERQQELPTLEFLRELMLHQHNSDRGFSFEQPYGFSMLTDSPVSRLHEVAGVRVWRADQCMLGARDERNQPVRKSTAILSNRRWRHVKKRCDNHRGLPHGILQGQTKGINRTALAAAQSACVNSMAKICGRYCARTMRWASRNGHRNCCGHTLFYYSCERCQLGRAAPPGMERSMVPGQRRYGQPGMRRARAAAATTAEPADAQQPAPPAPPAPPTSPAVAEAASPTASSVPKEGDLESTTGPWKFLASNGDYSRIALECDSSVQLSVEGKLYCTVADVAHVH